MKATILTILLFPSIAFCDWADSFLSPEERYLRIQERQLEVQEQTLRVVQQNQFDRQIENIQRKDDESSKIWGWFNSLPSEERKALIAEWNKSRPDCPFPCNKK